MIIEEKVQQWARDRNINQKTSQANKVVEEVGEFNKNLLILISNEGKVTEPNQTELADAVGDIQVTLIVLAMLTDVDYNATKPLAVYTRDLEKPKDFDVFQTMMLSVMLTDTLGDLLTAMGKGWQDKLEKAFGQIQSLVKMNAQNVGVDYDKALLSAYDVIANRTGKTVNGQFVKTEDLHS